MLNRLLFLRDEMELPSESELNSLADTTISTLEAEVCRPKAKNGKVGGLLDFTAQKKPVILVPDLHARVDFLINLLQWKPLGTTVLESLKKSKILVLCVGDYVHSETNDFAYKRWLNAFAYWQRGEINSRPMRQEMHDSLATLMSVMELKNAFPESFFLLKGNHENIQNKEGGGDHSFMKFVMEGSMVLNFMQEVFSDASLHLISCFEKTLPIVANFSDFCVSHAEPAICHTIEEIVNYHEDDETILDFTWTANGEALEGSVAQQFLLLHSTERRKKPLWFSGHRPVPEKFLTRQGGALIQFHNPEKMNVVFLQPNKLFSPEQDILSILL